jgi:hypothetical protein
MHRYSRVHNCIFAALLLGQRRYGFKNPLYLNDFFDFSTKKFFRQNRQNKRQCEQKVNKIILFFCEKCLTSKPFFVIIKRNSKFFPNLKKEEVPCFEKHVTASNEKVRTHYCIDVGFGILHARCCRL